MAQFYLAIFPVCLILKFSFGIQPNLVVLCRSLYDKQPNNNFEHSSKKLSETANLGYLVMSNRMQSIISRALFYLLRNEIFISCFLSKRLFVSLVSLLV